MYVHFEVLAAEISLNKDKTVYNHLHWDMKRNPMGISHFIERYDDVDEHSAFYEFYRDDEPFCTGEGDGIDENSVGRGGVSVMVCINYPQYIIKK